MSARARSRLAAYIADQKLSQDAAARRFGCSQGLVSKLVRGERSPGRQLANRIEDATAGWADGPIASREWDGDQGLAATGS